MEGWHEAVEGGRTAANTWRSPKLRLLHVGGGPSYRSMRLKERAKLLETEQLELESMRGRRKASSSRARSSSQRGRASRHTRCSRPLFCSNDSNSDRR